MRAISASSSAGAHRHAKPRMSSCMRPLPCSGSWAGSRSLTLIPMSRPPFGIGTHRKEGSLKRRSRPTTGRAISGRPLGLGVVTALAEPVCLEDLAPGMRPPQSFRYVEPTLIESLNDRALCPIAYVHASHSRSIGPRSSSGNGCAEVLPLQYGPPERE